MDPMDRPVADMRADYTGKRATIEANGSYTLPWSIVLEDGRRLADCGSYATALRTFERLGLIAGGI